jgi:Zn-dependent protease
LPSAGGFLFEFLTINLALFLFNLLPLAPLDGEKVITFFLPDHWVEAYERIRPYSPYILLALVFVLPMFGLDLIGLIIRRPLQNLALFMIGG